MKKFLCILISAVCMTALGGCDEKLPSPVDDIDESSFRIDYSPQISDNIDQVSIINRNQNKTVSAPEESISFKEACEMLDKMSMKETYLPQSMKDYKKLYFGTIDYVSEKYYSVYPYIEAANKKIFVGTNCLVSCDGSDILKKTWIGDYAEVTSSADTDKSLEELYPGAKVTPNEILTVLAEHEKSLSLEHDISKYIFEVADKLVDIDGKKCYKIMPKIEFMDGIRICQSFYGTVDGSNEIWQADISQNGKYKKLV